MSFFDSPQFEVSTKFEPASDITLLRPPLKQIFHGINVLILIVDRSSRIYRLTFNNLKSNQMNIIANKLPIELLVEVLRFLDFRGLIACKQVSFNHFVLAIY